MREHIPWQQRTDICRHDIEYRQCADCQTEDYLDALSELDNESERDRIAYELKNRPDISTRTRHDRLLQAIFDELYWDRGEQMDLFDVLKEASA